MGRLPRRELLQALEALGALVAAALAIRLLPFRLLVRTIGRPARPAPAGDEAAASSAAEVRKAIRRVAPRLTWKAACFEQGLAAHWMLRRRGIPSLVHYGARQADSDLSAHVWVTVGGTPIVGEEEAARHTRVAVFPPAPDLERHSDE